jgi:hypothetical protein
VAFILLQVTLRRTALTAGFLASVLIVPAAPALADDTTLPEHSSDGVQGEIAAPLPPNARIQARRVTTAAYEVAPGVSYTSWDETNPRGPIRAHLLTIRYDTPGLQFDYAGPSKVADTEPVSSMMASDAIAAVNADFFDIGDTGAPLGVGKQRGKGMVHAPREGWNSAFMVGGNGTPKIETLPMKAKMKQHPRWKITNINSPNVAEGGIGVYTHKWGATSGSTVVGGQTSRVAQVIVEKGRVVRMNRKLSTGRDIKRGFVLVGRDAGARQLAQLSKGDRVKVNWRFAGSPQAAVTGNRFLLQDGVRVVVDDREMHPRTAIGISTDTHEVFLLVVDGRQSFSRGYTMVELANLMTSLGAEDALNLDGGGSSTMISSRADGTRGVLNSPSDGAERSVANALQLFYRP